MKKQEPKKKPATAATKPRPGGPAAKASPLFKRQVPLLYHRQNYIILAGGALLVVIGLLLMTGGHMPDPNTWDESIIYSFRRTVLAPIVILAGLAAGVVAIFRR